MIFVWTCSPFPLIQDPRTRSAFQETLSYNHSKLLCLVQCLLHKSFLRTPILDNRLGIVNGFLKTREDALLHQIGFMLRDHRSCSDRNCSLAINQEILLNKGFPKSFKLKILNFGTFIVKII